MDWETRLSRWADSMEEKAGKVADWGSEEVPEYIRELIQWEITSNLLLIGALVVVIVVAAFALRVLYYRVAINDKLPEEVMSLLVAFLGVPAIIVIGVSTFHSYWAAERAAKAYVAPRVVVVEKITALVKNPQFRGEEK